MKSQFAIEKRSNLEMVDFFTNLQYILEIIEYIVYFLDFRAKNGPKMTQKWPKKNDFSEDARSGSPSPSERLTSNSRVASDHQNRHHHHQKSIWMQKSKI